MNSFNSSTINNCCIQHQFVDIFINDTYIQVAVWVTKKVSKQYTLYVLLWIFTSYSTNFKQISQSKECYCKQKSAYWKKHNHRHAKKAMIWKCPNVKHNFIQHIKCFISNFKSIMNWVWIAMQSLLHWISLGMILLKNTNLQYTMP